MSTDLKTHKQIYVGLSGGVDSAVSAALLKQQGHQVTGVFIRTWHPEGFPCSEGEDEREAMRVAAHLDIPFCTLDLRDRYKDYVAQLMIEGYAKGETPNPDVLCNREVKFGGFVDFAKKEGADAIATGHYARLEHSDRGVTLMRGKDAEKDQSYFLALVPNEQLAFALFPIGNLHKTEVRRLAQSFQLPNAARKDSQGICFLGAVDLQKFLSKYVSIVPGVVLSAEGETVGSHDGAALYTIGERHGFSVIAKSANTQPLYVIKTDIRRNTVTVGDREALQGNRIVVLRDVVTHQQPPVGNATAQVRYHGTLYDASVQYPSDGFAQVTFANPVLVAKGQVVVLYKDDSLVLAGFVAELL